MTKSILLKDLIEKFLTDLSSIKRLSQNTIKAYRTDLFNFVDFCSGMKIYDVSKIGEKTIRSYVIHLNEQKLSKTSISRKLSSLRTLFKDCYSKNIINFNPAADIHNPKTKRKLPDVITLDSFLEIFTFVKEEKSDEKASLIKTIFELLYGCALRVSELCSLDLIDVDLSKMTLRIKGKGSKIRIVPVGSKSSVILKEYLKYRETKSISSNALLVTNSGKRIYERYVHRIVKKYLTKVCDAVQKSPHLLRHSAATHMLDRGADIIAIKEILGHTSLSTTQIYTRVSIERLKKTYKTSHPKS